METTAQQHLLVSCIYMLKVPLIILCIFLDLLPWVFWFGCYNAQRCLLLRPLCTPLHLPSQVKQTRHLRQKHLKMKHLVNVSSGTHNEAKKLGISPNTNPATFQKGKRTVGRTRYKIISSLTFFKWSFSWFHICCILKKMQALKRQHSGQLQQPTRKIIPNL